MATKKQKRLIGEQKQAINRAESIESGLKAQAKAKQRQEAIAKKRAAEETEKGKKDRALKAANAMSQVTKAS